MFALLEIRLRSKKENFLGSESDFNSHWDTLKKYQSKGPLLNAEFYSGWVTYWNESEVHTTPANPLADSLRYSFL